MQPALKLDHRADPWYRPLWGKIASGLVIAFLLFDSITKVLQSSFAMDGTVELGYPASMVLPIGLILLICTVLYAIPRTAFLGALLLTGYLGGAVATHVRVGNPLLGYTLFPVYFGILLWAGLTLRDARLRALITNESQPL